MGLPGNWSRCRQWIIGSSVKIPVSRQRGVGSSLKCKEIPRLQDYKVIPGQEFWEKFPFKDVPSKIEASVDTEKFKELLKENKEYMKDSERTRAETCIENLRTGASSFQKTVLPANFSKNAPSATNSGAEVTDVIASWIKKGFVAGPFSQPPLPQFRVNSLMAIVQGPKVRPVLNVSLPKSFSFNDNIEVNAMEKVKMTSARAFSYSVVEAGKGALMSKFDMTDAYKNIPAQLEDLRLQGFQWLGCYFVELRQIFGAKSAVANYDIFGNTVLAITCAICGIPEKWIHRTLDDVPFVASIGSGLAELFCKTYKQICRELNVGLAPECELFEKAFTLSKYGKVLGVFFETNTASWCLPEDKKEKSLEAIREVLASSPSVKSFQKLMGRLNDISIMCPFLKGFKMPLNMCLSAAIAKEVPLVELSVPARRDLEVWARFLMDKEKWIPICHRYSSPPTFHSYFTSDAAGCSVDSSDNYRLGCGNVGFSGTGIIIFAYQLFWPRGILQAARDSKESSLGSKTTTLEFLGILVPFLVAPELMLNQNIVVKVDNIGCFFGWVNKHAHGDVMASILIKALHLIGAYLSCQIHIEHLPRKSSWDANLVDRLSRERTTTNQDRKLLQSFDLPGIPSCLVAWMNDPSEDWSLPEVLLESVEMKLNLK